MHPRNRHTGRYDFDTLTRVSPDLNAVVKPNPHGDRSIDFADPTAVRALNRALLTQFYGITGWDIPPNYLCPPIPGRSDYIHYAADLLADANGNVPRGPEVRVLDIGTGANCIYPLVGTCEYGWGFVGTDIEPAALASAQRILDSNPSLQETIELRLQKQPLKTLTGIVKPTERFELLVCNPPFHASAQAVEEESRKKWNKLSKRWHGAKLNFGGQSNELWCPGGEVGFLTRLIQESVSFGSQIRIFTSLVSKSQHLDPIYRELERARVADVETVEMSQGQKISRLVAWTF